VGREEEGMSSNRPELVALRKFLETHPDNENLLYLTDSEATLQSINKWIGGGAKLSLANSADGGCRRPLTYHRQTTTTSEGEGSNPGRYVGHPEKTIFGTQSCFFCGTGTQVSFYHL
jgi:hypothetical protein